MRRAITPPRSRTEHSLSEPRLRLQSEAVRNCEGSLHRTGWWCGCAVVLHEVYFLAGPAHKSANPAWLRADPLTLNRQGVPQIGGDLECPPGRPEPWSVSWSAPGSFIARGRAGFQARPPVSIFDLGGALGRRDSELWGAEKQPARDPPPTVYRALGRRVDVCYRALGRRDASLYRALGRRVECPRCSASRTANTSRCCSGERLARPSSRTRANFLSRVSHGMLP